MGNEFSISFLESLLKDKSEDEMVRHEAAEALAAIGDEASIDTLAAFLDDASVPVRETCELGIARLKLKQKEGKKGEKEEKKAEKKEKKEEINEELNKDSNSDLNCEKNEMKFANFNSVDPSLPFAGCTDTDALSLYFILTDPQTSLAIRYRALFTLRDLRAPAAVALLAAALQHDSSSALLRHELAFVLGQIRYPPAAAAAAAAPAPAAAAAPAPAAAAAGGEGREEFLAAAAAAAARRHAAAADAAAAAAAAATGGPPDAAAAAAATAAAAALLQRLDEEPEQQMVRHEAALALGSLAAAAEAAAAKLNPQKASQQLSLFCKTLSGEANEDTNENAIQKLNQKVEDFHFQEKDAEKTMREVILQALQKQRHSSSRVVAESCLVALWNVQEELGIDCGV
ncbi:PBS lyase HEAT-like repeat domain-containing protein, putative [Eimeria tenella]|uniref:PBS lyase HEAT-like repeat domain-containing protein, putative n=1 Tax=Eimeria tenella TaxID=5802 RepID=U6KVW7_EIMTE|nr:PBS lyase HEAT-like repeat domain-containing protein, putative [Eimeria tenella]CDJ42282.1 PBS lyase HEAT-like repeat domain-containing protein, putative [Eimeria tenella]|eukprot:XP_013233032.1 PBS lyase HEAT-like repeat domain-containing protein, putative [Eimeria tenella]